MAFSNKKVPSILGTRNFYVFTMKTSEKILEYISKNGQSSGKELVDYVGDITPRAIRKQLKILLDAGKLKKIGRPPKVFYSMVTVVPASGESKGTSMASARSVVIGREIARVIEARYLYITPTGEMALGLEGFSIWCEKTKQDLEKTAKEYVRTLEKYDAFLRNGLIDGTEKLKTTFKEVFVKRLYYVDFYSIERFGKTRLGQLLLHSKNSQDRNLIKTLTHEIRPKILDLIKKYSIDGVLFVPPTVKREIQFMKELEKQLELPVRTLSVTKVKTPITVAQKTLSKLDDRVENARKTIVVEDGGTYENILIIDDAVGSGASINETAAQIQKKGLCNGRIIGLAITGSFNGFDVISEV